MYVTATAMTLILASLYPGECIKCHECATGIQQCQDPFNASEYLMDCDLLSIRSGITYKSCMKLESPDSLNGKQVNTVRSCAERSCDDVRDAFVKANASVTFCGECDSNGCNFGTTRWPTLAVLDWALPLATVLPLLWGSLWRNT